MKCGPTTVQIDMRCASGLAARKHRKATSPALQRARAASPPPFEPECLPRRHQGALLLATSWSQLENNWKYEFYFKARYNFHYLYGIDWIFLCFPGVGFSNRHGLWNELITTVFILQLISLINIYNFTLKLEITWTRYTFYILSQKSAIHNNSISIRWNVFGVNV